jgi:hypothetical protein
VEGADSKLRIFISYGHDEYVTLAERLKLDLEGCGHAVWFDSERLNAGRYWEAHIEQGLNWVSEVRDMGRMLLLMTPHSVRQPDGYCLNELARVMERKVSVLPVMVAWCEAPLSIARVQWFDMTDCVPLASGAEKYREKFPRLLRSLKEGRAVPLLSRKARYAEKFAGLLALASLTDRIHAVSVRASGGAANESAAMRRASQFRSLPGTFSAGERVRLAIHSERSCHFLLLNISDPGEAVCLCPSWFAPAPKLKEGTNYFPQESSCYDVFPLNDPGRECLLAVLSDRPIWLDLMPSDQRIPAAVLGERQIERLIDELRSLERSHWEALVTYLDVEFTAGNGERLDPRA